jgi:NAD(P)-dependent dehydrogenase (short-subunit alcohol dehydrogenase family)
MWQVERMQTEGNVALVTGGASGLGRATAKRLLDDGATVVIVDLPTSPGVAVATELGDRAHFVAADVTSESAIAKARATAESLGELRVLVHCAGKPDGVPVIADGDSLRLFRASIETNLVGAYNVLSQCAASMAQLDEVDGERGVCVLTASIAGLDGQVGVTGYTAAKAGVIGLTLVSAWDLAAHKIRVCSIAPGMMKTPMLGGIPADIQEKIEAGVPHPSRLGDPAEFADLAATIIRNAYLNGETIRIDGAVRLAPF